MMPHFKIGDSRNVSTPDDVSRLIEAIAGDENKPEPRNSIDDDICPYCLFPKKEWG